MSEHAGTDRDPRVAAAEDAAEPEQPEPLDATQVAEDPNAREEEPERLYEA